MLPLRTSRGSGQAFKKHSSPISKGYEMRGRKITGRLRLFLIIVFGVIFATCPSNCQEILDGSEPLTIDEGRVILGHLYELRSCRKEVETLRKYINQDAEQDNRERELVGIQTALMNEKLDLVYKSAEIQRERADLYETLYRAITAKPSLRCRIAKALTIGLYQCR